MDQMIPLGRLWRSDLMADIESLTSVGGRLVGSHSETQALNWLRGRLGGISNVRLKEHSFPYQGWSSDGASLAAIDGNGGELRCHPLYWSGATPSDGITAELVHLGRGAEDDFRACRNNVAGRIVIVQHEFPFASNTIHRRVKYRWSREFGACGFIIVSNIVNDVLVTGSCGVDASDNIPAIGVSLEGGEALRRIAEAHRRVRLKVATSRAARMGVNLIAEAPGQKSEWVIVCAHYDGHDLAQSALDNASGVAVAINVFEAFAPFVHRLRRGLKLILFTAEESGLLGSRLYVDGLEEHDRSQIALAVNLDVLAGGERITCLSSGFEQLDQFIEIAAARASLPCYRPLLRNSDHFNFARRGIPAVRLLAGFDEPLSDVRYILTDGDTAKRVLLGDLKRSARVAGELIWSALKYPGAIADHRPMDLLKEQ